jgi:hypothetical protein
MSEPCTLLRDYRHGLTAVDAEALVKAWAGVGNPAWAILQSYPRIYFGPWNGNFEQPFGEIFCGRIFGELGEVRWTGGAEFEVWYLREAVTGEPCLRQKERYYTWGEYDGHQFTEDVVPRLAEHLPVPPGPCNTGDRPFVQVYEYLPELRALDGLTEDTLMSALNQPRMFTHRFAGYDCGKDEENWEGNRL